MCTVTVSSALSVSLCVWIRTKAEDPAPCLYPSWLPPRPGLLNNRRHTHTHTFTKCTLLSHTKACAHSRPPVPTRSSQGRQNVPAAISLNEVGGVDRKIVCPFVWNHHVWCGELKRHTECMCVEAQTLFTPPLKLCALHSHVVQKQHWVSCVGNFLLLL